MGGDAERVATNARVPRRSATVAVVRDSVAGIEVLLLRRAPSRDHTSGAWVFPGGVVDPGDAAAADCCSGIGDAAADRLLSLPHGGMAYLVAAVRECFEECGLLFAADARDEGVRFDDRDDDLGARIAAWREPLHRHERTLAEFCASFGLTLALDRLVYVSHWLTPLGRTRRFDTRFFLAEAPAAQTAAFDGVELLEQAWWRPADALAQAGALGLLPPTRETLRLIGGFETVGALLAWARMPREIALTLPRDAMARDGPRVVLPSERAWAELGRIDPDGLGQGRCDIVPGSPVRLSPRVIRVTAANASVMTGPGTNTYLVGGGAGRPWAVIDPGPDDPAHLDAIVAAAPGPIGWIFVTHTHHDHSPGAGALKARTGATVLGRMPAFPEWQDERFAPDTLLAGGERFVLPGPDGEATTLEAIHTPGHASNHLCYLLVEEKLLFTGDHLMQATTVVINPPDGDMGAYVASLRALAQRDLDWLAPGHGFLMAEPTRAIEAVIAHRRRREDKLVEALRRNGPSDIDGLLGKVYDDVQSKVLAIAARSLEAHLLKLRDEGRVQAVGERWALTAP